MVYSTGDAHISRFLEMSRRSLEGQDRDLIQALEKQADYIKESAKMVGDRFATLEKQLKVARQETEKAKKEAEKAKKEAEKAKQEAEKIKQEAGRVRRDMEEVIK